MKIGILAAGTTPDDLSAEYPSYAQMFVNLFSSINEEFEYEFFDVRNDIFPASEQVADAWLITGSKHGVYENLPWMVRLKDLIVAINKAGKPLVGICFGHQIIAEAMGGKVEKFSGGWGLSLQTYKLLNSDDMTPDREFTINAIHQDQVVEKPAGADVIATSDFCQYAGLKYGDKIITFQAHPEFTVDFERSLLNVRKGTVLPDADADAGLNKLGNGATTDSKKVAGWLAEFIRR
ncbi:glutamine amidotransferase-related protein [Thalassolituus sp. LLYu03]|uniref:glutamine amidotransferase-related protein n=1 Tax=Thalassolituus sp. LLYu03 TaxID=3421656 RepID=UPI003D2E34E2